MCREILETDVSTRGRGSGHDGHLGDGLTIKLWRWTETNLFEPTVDTSVVESRTGLYVGCVGSLRRYRRRHPLTLFLQILGSQDELIRQ